MKIPEYCLRSGREHEAAKRVQSSGFVGAAAPVGVMIAAPLRFGGYSAASSSNLSVSSCGSCWYSRHAEGSLNHGKILISRR